MSAFFEAGRRNARRDTEVPRRGESREREGRQHKGKNREERKGTSSSTTTTSSSSEACRLSHRVDRRDISRCRCDHQGAALSRHAVARRRGSRGAHSELGGFEWLECRALAFDGVGKNPRERKLAMVRSERAKREERREKRTSERASESSTLLLSLLFFSARSLSPPLPGRRGPSRGGSFRSARYFAFIYIVKLVCVCVKKGKGKEKNRYLKTLVLPDDGPPRRGPCRRGPPLAPPFPSKNGHEKQRKKKTEKKTEKERQAN